MLILYSILGTPYSVGIWENHNNTSGRTVERCTTSPSWRGTIGNINMYKIARRCCWKGVLFGPQGLFDYRSWAPSWKSWDLSIYSRRSTLYGTPPLNLETIGPSPIGLYHGTEYFVDLGKGAWRCIINMYHHSIGRSNGDRTQVKIFRTRPVIRLLGLIIETKVRSTPYPVRELPLFETYLPASLAVRRSRHELHALAGASQWLGRGWGQKRV